MYGVFPYYISIEKDGNANGVFLLNSNAMGMPRNYHVIQYYMHYYMFLVLPSQSIILFAALSSLYIIHFSPPLLDSVNKLTIIRRWWAKYRDLSLVSRDQLFASAERQIIDPLTTDKSWSFAITEFNKNIVLSFGHRVCFSMNIFGKLPFSRKSGLGRHCAWADHYL